jgi:hypothetical protein
MAWDIHVRMDRHEECVIHVKARWESLASIYDVSLDCGRGVHPVSVDGPGRREMNAFSTPIRVAYRWDDAVERPQVLLTWNDAGETCEQVILLADRSQQWSQQLSSRLHHLVHPRSFVGSSTVPAERGTDEREATA